MMTAGISEQLGQRSRRRILLLIGALILAALVWRGASSMFGANDGAGPEAGPAVAGVTEIAVRDNAFAPRAIEVPAGTAVTWTWEGDSQHNVVGDGFESPVQAEGEFAYTFRDPGTYEYRCTLHGGMTGEVVVKGDSA